MNKFVKILVCIGIFIVGAVIIQIFKETSGMRNGIGGIPGLIVFFGIMAGLRAVWKYKPKEGNSITIKDDEHKLDKNS